MGPHRKERQISNSTHLVRLGPQRPLLLQQLVLPVVHVIRGVKVVHGHQLVSEALQLPSPPQPPCGLGVTRGNDDWDWLQELVAGVAVQISNRAAEIGS